LPITILIIFLILYTMFRSFKWAMLILATSSWPDRRTAGAVHHAHQLQRLFGVGFLALFGVSVQTGVIMLEYINQLRARARHGRKTEATSLKRGRRRCAAAASHHDDHAGGHAGPDAAALSHGIGSDSQRPFAIVIVGGLLANLVIGIFLLPTLRSKHARQQIGEDHAYRAGQQAQAR
jgi:cobalt-zinc-cadmium resistance protein CzcA